jgi:hypothetical protein
MTFVGFIAKLLERIGDNLMPRVDETAEPQALPDGERTIHVTPARRPVWPTCCG